MRASFVSPNKHRPSAWFAFALLPGLTIGAGGVVGQSTEGYPPVSVPIEFEQLGNGDVYFLAGISGVPGKVNEGLTANAGFVITGEGVIAFDALGTPSLGAAMIREIRETTNKPITHVVVSHYHADHIYGLQAFKDATDAQVVAHASASLYLTSPDAKQRLDQRRGSLAPWVNDKTRLVPPDLTFPEELTLESGGYRFNLIHAGPAHARDDILMMVEPAGVLFSGDIIQNGRVPFLNSPEVDTGSWLEGIEKVRQMNPEILVPGHGPATNDAMSALNFTHEYISFVREEMRKAVENWIPFEEAYEQTDWSKYAGLPAFNASNKGNAYRVYLEMEKAVLK